MLLYHITLNNTYTGVYLVLDWDTILFKCFQKQFGQFFNTTSAQFQLDIPMYYTDVSWMKWFASNFWILTKSVFLSNRKALIHNSPLKSTYDCQWAVKITAEHEMLTHSQTPNCKGMYIDYDGSLTICDEQMLTSNIFHFLTARKSQCTKILR